MSGVGGGLTRGAAADPGDVHDVLDVRATYREAQKLAAVDDNDKALVLIDQGLATAPKDLQLLELEGTVRLKLRDYEGALSAYQAYIDAGATGANRRTAQRIVASLGVVRSTGVDIAVTNGPASIYFDSKSLGVLCVAEPECKKGIVPGDYKVIAERAGFEKWTGRIAVTAKHVAKLAITLVEKPSAVTIAVAQPGAVVTVDGKSITGPAALSLPGGDHQLAVELAGFATEHRTFAAHEGQPVALAITLVPVVPIRTSTPAELTLDGARLVVEQGAAPLPPGEHVLVAHADGFHDARVTVPATRDADYRIALELAPIGALVDVAGAPAGTAVMVDGKVLATTPLAAPLEVPAGTHEVELHPRGFLPWRERRAFPGNQPAHLRLAKLRPESKKHTYMTAGGTVLALALGGLTGAAALHERDLFAARAASPGVTAGDPQLHAFHDRGDRYAILADAAFGLGIVGIAATTYLWTHEGRGESEGSVHFGVGVGTAMLSGRF